MTLQYHSSIPPHKMLLHHTPFMDLYLYTGIDVLYVQWPDMKNPLSWELEHCFNLIRETINLYNISGFVIDSRGTTMQLNPDAHHSMVTRSAAILNSTRLRKIARLGTHDQTREDRTAAIIDQVRTNMPGSASFVTFADELAALHWLLAA